MVYLEEALVMLPAVTIDSERLSQPVVRFVSICRSCLSLWLNLILQ